MPRPKRCKVCKRITKHKSHKGNCLSCARNKSIAVNKQLRAKKGKHYNKWLRKLLQSLKQK